MAPEKGIGAPLGLKKGLIKKNKFYFDPDYSFNAAGEEQKAQRVVGFKSAEEFTTIVKEAFR